MIGRRREDSECRRRWGDNLCGGGRTMSALGGGEMNCVVRRRDDELCRRRCVNYSCAQRREEFLWVG